MSTNLPTISKNEMISVLQGGLNLSGSYVSEKIWLNDFNFYIEKGSIIHLNNGKIHKDDGPAIEHCKDENGNNEFIEGRLIKKGLYYSEEFTKTREKEILKRKVSKI